MSLLSHKITTPLWEACIKTLLSVEGILMNVTYNLKQTVCFVPLWKALYHKKTLNSIVPEYDFPGYIVLQICACVFEWESIYHRRIIDITILIC